MRWAHGAREAMLVSLQLREQAWKNVPSPQKVYSSEIEMVRIKMRLFKILDANGNSAFFGAGTSAALNLKSWERLLSVNLQTFIEFYYTVILCVDPIPNKDQLHMCELESVAPLDNVKFELRGSFLCVGL